MRFMRAGVDKLRTSAWPASGGAGPARRPLLTLRNHGLAMGLERRECLHHREQLLDTRRMVDERVGVLMQSDPNLALIRTVSDRVF